MGQVFIAEIVIKWYNMGRWADYGQMWAEVKIRD
jgi:hypothetical protein